MGGEVLRRLMKLLNDTKNEMGYKREINPEKPLFSYQLRYLGTLLSSRIIKPIFEHNKNIFRHTYPASHTELLF